MIQMFRTCSKCTSMLSINRASNKTPLKYQMSLWGPFVVHSMFFVVRNPNINLCFHANYDFCVLDLVVGESVGQYTAYELRFVILLVNMHYKIRTCMRIAHTDPLGPAYTSACEMHAHVCYMDVSICGHSIYGLFLVEICFWYSKFFITRPFNEHWWSSFLKEYHANP